MSGKDNVILTLEQAREDGSDIYSYDKVVIDSSKESKDRGI